MWLDASASIVYSTVAMIQKPLSHPAGLNMLNARTERKEDVIGNQEIRFVSVYCRGSGTSAMLQTQMWNRKAARQSDFPQQSGDSTHILINSSIP